MKMLEILPAVCLAQNAMCETKVVFKLYANHDTAKMSGYCENYAMKLPAMSGRTDF
jgi:hypothetical protein